MRETPISDHNLFVLAEILPNYAGEGKEGRWKLGKLSLKSLNKKTDKCGTAVSG